MANTKSAKKAIRVSGRKQEYNKPQRTRAKTAVTKVKDLIASGDLDAAQQAARAAASILDKAASKEVIHPNKAARRKSRLTKQINAALKKGESSE